MSLVLIPPTDQDTLESLRAKQIQNTQRIELWAKGVEASLKPSGVRSMERVGQGIALDDLRNVPMSLLCSSFSKDLQLANGSDRGKVTITFKYLGVGNTIVGSGANVTYTADLAVAGPNGLRSGLTEAANTWYAVYMIAGDGGAPVLDTTGNALQPPIWRPSVKVAAFLDTADPPTLPPGFNRARRVGYVRNNGSSDLYRFTNAVGDEWFWWNEALSSGDFRIVNVTSVAAVDTWYDASAAKVAPPSCRSVIVNGYCTDTAPGTMILRLKNKDHGNSGAYGIIIAARYVDIVQMSAKVGTDSAQAFQYQTNVLTRDVILDVLAYRDLV